MRRFVVRPFALAGSPREVLIAGLCVMLLGGVFIAEILTPDVVVGALALLPLLAALWLLSSRPASVVAVAAIAFFGATVALETANRMTVILVGATVLVTAVMARFYATAVASVLSSRRHTRPAIKTWGTPLSQVRGAGSSYGLRSLTQRELEVARLGAEGYTAAEIGRRLNIVDRTVESHLASIYSKLSIRSRLQLVRMASNLGSPPEV